MYVTAEVEDMMKRDFLMTIRDDGGVLCVTVEVEDMMKSDRLMAKDDDGVMCKH